MIRCQLDLSCGLCTYFLVPAIFDTLSVGDEYMSEGWLDRSDMCKCISEQFGF